MGKGTRRKGPCCRFRIGFERLIMAGTSIPRRHKGYLPRI